MYLLKIRIDTDGDCGFTLEGNNQFTNIKEFYTDGVYTCELYFEDRQDASDYLHLLITQIDATFRDSRGMCSGLHDYIHWLCENLFYMEKWFPYFYIEEDFGNQEIIIDLSHVKKVVDSTSKFYHYVESDSQEPMWMGIDIDGQLYSYTDISWKDVYQEALLDKEFDKMQHN